MDEPTAPPVFGPRLKINGHDFGRITGHFVYSRDVVRECVGWTGSMQVVPGDAELRIDTDAMILADVPPDISRRLQFCEQMIAYLKSSVSQRGDAPFKPQYVPSRIRLLKRVCGDWPIGHTTCAASGDYDCHSNQWGAISVLAGDGQWLGIKPDECEILEFCPNPHLTAG